MKYAYIPGITEQRFQEYDDEQNDEAYELSQKQRELERRIRHAKREMAMMIELDDKQGIVDADDKIKERQADLRRFIKKTGRTRRRNREQLY